MGIIGLPNGIYNYDYDLSLQYFLVIMQEFIQRKLLGEYVQNLVDNFNHKYLNCAILKDSIKNDGTLG